MLHKAWNSKGEMPYCFPRSSFKFQGHTVLNITDFDPNWAFPDYRPVAAFKSLRFALFMRNMTEVAIPWWNVDLKKLTIGLQLHMPWWVIWFHNQWGNNACSLMHDCLELTASWYELTHNTPKHFQTCHKINNSIVSYKTVDDQQNSYFIIG